MKENGEAPVKRKFNVEFGDDDCGDDLSGLGPDTALLGFDCAQYDNTKCVLLTRSLMSALLYRAVLVCIYTLPCLWIAHHCLALARVIGKLTNWTGMETMKLTQNGAAKRASIFLLRFGTC